MSIDVGSGRGAESLNLANGNFAYLMYDVLGIAVVGCGSIPAARLLEAVKKVEAAISAGRSAEFERPEERPAPNFVMCGMNRDYLVDRLARLRAIAEAALAAGEECVPYG